MTGSQVETHDSCCGIATTAYPCPICGNLGRKVSSLTLDNHVLNPLRREKIGNEATFCLNPDCDVVYCNPVGYVVRKEQTNLPVTLKDPGEDVFVCYCFGYKRWDLRRDIREKGKTDIPEQIKKGVKEGRCDCERKNPQGACCLGNVSAAIKTIQKQAGIAS